MRKHENQSIKARLKAIIEETSDHLYQSAPLFAGARQGLINYPVIARYLHNVWYALCHSEAHLRHSTRAAEAMGNPALAQFFSEKVKEESGHETWAESDVARIPLTSAEKSQALQICSTMKDYVSFVSRVVEENTVGYIGYILFAEYLTVLIGPKWIRALEEHCGITPEMMSVIGKHAEIDRHHVQDDLNIIEKLQLQTDDADKLFEVVQTAARLFEAFAHEVVTNGGVHGRTFEARSQANDSSLSSSTKLE